MVFLCSEGLIVVCYGQRTGDHQAVPVLEFTIVLYQGDIDVIKEGEQRLQRAMQRKRRIFLFPATSVKILYQFIRYDQNTKTKLIISGLGKPCSSSPCSVSSHRWHNVLQKHGGKNCRMHVDSNGAKIIISDL